VPGVSMHYELVLTRAEDNDVMTIRFEPDATIGADAAAVEKVAAEAAERIHRALHVRLECKPVPCDSLPRFELKTKRMIDQRPKEFRRALDR